MIRPLLLLDIVLALLALCGLCAAGLNMIYPDFDPELLLAVLALLGTHVTILFMATELYRWGSIWTELALDGLVCCLIVLLTICFCHNITALAALVIVSSAANLMHPNLADLDGSLACGAHLRFFLCDGFHHFFSLIFKF